jgi:metallo-beta-lactamase family protein
MQLTFIGATGTVTGSKYLLTDGDKNILIDCGLFQGYKELRLRNWATLPIDPHTIDAVVLTHAHIDHSGYIPLLIKHGFRGKIYCTPATKDLCAILLPDSGYLQEEEARLANKFHSSKHNPALPLYTKEEALESLKYFSAVDFDSPLKLFKTFTINFHRAGHILGASFISIKHHSVTLTFSGDLGRPHDPVMRAPDAICETDYLVLESTYGDRLHEGHNPQEKIGEIIRETAKRGGSVIIPAFAVGRAQMLLYYIYQLKMADKIPEMPIFLDSPMAQNATDLLCRYQHEHRQSEEECNNFCSVADYVTTLEESHKIDHPNVPCIIIAASGMATGGRILRHLQQFAPNYRNTILFTGYQAGGTRGDRIVRGERKVKIFGEMVPIKAHVELLSNLSAHADYQEILDWLSTLKKNPKKVFITHGEPEAALSLKKKIEDKFGWTCVIPHYLQKENL